MFFKEEAWGFPGGPVVKSLPCDAGDMASIPGRETEIPHPTEKLSQCTTTTQPPGPTAREPEHHKKRSLMTQLRPEAAKLKKKKKSRTSNKTLGEVFYLRCGPGNMMRAWGGGGQDSKAVITALLLLWAPGAPPSQGLRDGECSTSLRTVPAT